MRPHLATTIRIAVTLLIVFPALPPGASEAPVPTGTLAVRIAGLASDEGRVRLGLYDSPETYLARDGAYRAAALRPAGGACVWVLEALPYGDYAVMVHHDVNGNGRMDTNLVGYPTEPFGFSNGVRPFLSQPAFDRVRVRLAAPRLAIEIHPR